MRSGVEKYLEDSPFDAALWEEFRARLVLLAGGSRSTAARYTLRTGWNAVAAIAAPPGNVLFYFQRSPATTRASPKASLAGAANNAAESGAWRRIIVEKPFGHDTSSAREFELAPAGRFRRVRHLPHRCITLGKERPEHPCLPLRQRHFEPLWNRRYVDHVQISTAETIGVEGRGAYYQEAGALRDMIQNHLLQVMATIAMEPPAMFESTAVRDERAKAPALHPPFSSR